MSSECEGPPSKRVKLEQAPPKGSVSEKLLRLSEPIRDYLNVPEVLSQTLRSDDLDFLNEQQQNKIWNLCDQQRPSKYLSSRILSFVKVREESERDEAARKFLACVVLAKEHRGHLELTKIFRKKLGQNEWKKIEDILYKVRDSPLPSPYTTPQNSPVTRLHPAYSTIVSPDTPVSFIYLQGPVIEQDFVKIERELWLAFSTGDYNSVNFHVSCVKEKCSLDTATYNVDCEIVALWFQSLVFMHRDRKYKDAIHLLKDAESLTQKSDNEMILSGRIHQRMAQIYLMMHEKDCAATYFMKAKEELQFVGRGYDKTNMFCREAKVLSATEPHRRDEIEKVYEMALCTLEKDDPYFLASFPSVTLSKAAFHLHVAFGSKQIDAGNPPSVNSDDINKTRETLKDFKEDEHILIDMKRNEYDFLQAELCRLEGNFKDAKRMFTEITNDEKKVVKNVFSLASHRLKWINKTFVCSS